VGIFKGDQIMSDGKIDKAELERLAREGHGVREIARKLGHSPGGVSKALQKLRIKSKREIDMKETFGEFKASDSYGEELQVRCVNCSFHLYDCNTTNLTLPLKSEMFGPAPSVASEGLLPPHTEMHHLTCPDCGEGSFPYMEGHPVETLFLGHGLYYHVGEGRKMNQDELEVQALKGVVKGQPKEEGPAFAKLEIQPQRQGKFGNDFCKIRSTDCTPDCRIWLNRDGGAGLCYFAHLLNILEVEVPLETKQEAYKLSCFLDYKACKSELCTHWVWVWKGESESQRKGACGLQALVLAAERFLRIHTQAGVKE
jgi:hypothetical protein